MLPQEGFSSFYGLVIVLFVSIHTGWSKSRFTVVSTCNTEFLLV